MSQNGNDNHSIPQIMIAFATVCATMFAGVASGYYFGRDSATSENAALKRDLNLLTASKDAVSIIKTLETLKTSNENLFRFEEHAQEVDKLSKKILDANATIDDLKHELLLRDEQIQTSNDLRQKAIAEADKLNRLLRKKHTMSEHFTLSEHKSQVFFDGDVIVGLQTNYVSWVNIRVLGGDENLDVGESYRFGINGTGCKLTYIGVAENGSDANFSMVCG